MPALLTATALLLLPGIAVAAAPTATTGPATNVYSFQATVGATVNPSGGASTTVRFRYGTDPALLAAGTQLTATQPVSASGTYSATITGLSPGTAYYVRAEATNADGSDAGDPPVGFATFPGQTASTSGAVNITPSSALLVGSLNPGGLPTQARFIWGMRPTQLTRFTSSASTAHLTGSTTQQVAIPLTGLPANTTIYYQLRSDREAPVQENAVLGAPVRSFRTLRALTGISARGTRTKFGATSTVSGAVAGAGIGGVTVVAQVQRYPFDGPFTTVASARTMASGRYNIRLPRLYGKTRVRALTEGAPVLISATRTINVTPSVGFTVRRMGGRRVFTGSIHPRLGSDARARIQRKSKGRWVTIRTLRFSGGSATSSRYTTTLSRRHRTTSYRVQVRTARADLATGVSRTRTLR